MAYYRAMGRGLFEEAEHMNKIKVIDIVDTVMPINVYITDPRQLLMFSCGGLYWLVPYEVVKNYAMSAHIKYKSTDVYSIPSLDNITIEQCIPIPSETARILLGL